MNFDYSQKVKTLSNHLVSFMDKNIYPTSIMDVGELIITGPNIVKRYVGENDINKLYTGDLAIIENDYLSILDRP